MTTQKLTADEIKQQAMEAGIPEWFFDEISDEILERDYQNIHELFKLYLNSEA